MTTIVVQPQPIPTAISAPTPHVATNLEQLEEGVAPRIRIQKPKKTESLKDINESPIFKS